MSETDNNKPLAVFGVITDIQYADADDTLNFDQDRYRHYRNSVNLVKNAIDYWRSFETTNNINIKFIIQLGDAIDGKAKRLNDSTRSINLILNIFEEFCKNLNNNEPRLFHIWGNHEFYNFQRSELIHHPLNTSRAIEKCADPNGNYYFYDVTDKLKLICLDFYVFSMLGYEQTDEMYMQALDQIRKFNKNEDLNNSAGMCDENKRYVAYNGGLDKTQLDWLNQQLDICHSLNKKVIICGHIPIHVEASNSKALAFNSEQILDVLWKYDKTVLAYFAGHYHEGAHFKDEHNIQHITFPAIVETEPDSNSFGIVKVYENKILVDLIQDFKKEFEIFF